MTLADGLNQSWAILKMVLPSMGLTGILLGTFYGGRFSGRYKEQKEIVKTMPQCFVDEVNARDKIIAELTIERDRLLAENLEHRAAMKTIRDLTLKIEGTARGTVARVLPLESRLVKVKAITKKI